MQNLLGEVGADVAGVVKAVSVSGSLEAAAEFGRVPAGENGRVRGGHGHGVHHQFAVKGQTTAEGDR